MKRASIALCAVLALAAACGEAPSEQNHDTEDMATADVDASEVADLASAPDAAVQPDGSAPPPSRHDWPEVLAWWQSLETEPLCGDVRLTVAAISRFCLAREHLWSRGDGPYAVRCRTANGTIVDSPAYRTVECSG